MLLLLILLGLLLTLRNSKAKAAADAVDVPPDPPEGLDRKVWLARLPGLRSSFRKAARRLRRYGGGSAAAYKVPWFLLMGDRDRRGLLSQAGLGAPFGPPGADDRIVGQGLKWWFFDRGVVLDVKSSTEGPFWMALLRQLQRYRPRRPIDGVVVTVPCSQLRAARWDGAARLELQSRGERLYERIWQAQRHLGIRFPIYLMVTGCEAVPEMPGFARRLPDHLKDEIFGWSSPYGIETAFRADWVKEAFQGLAERLRQLQAELFASTVPESDADSVFFYPGELFSLQEPLRAFASRLFQQSAYHETLVVRGIYFTGSEADVVPAGEEEPGLEPPRSLFVRDLVEQKIFPEATLGAPTAATLVARNRRVMGVQVALFCTAVLLAAGSWWSSLQLHEGNRALVPLLDAVALDLGQMRESRKRGDAPNRVVATRRAARLFDAFSRVDLDAYNSIFLPASWFDDTDGRLRSSVRVGFEEIIFIAIRMDLEQRTEDLLQARTFGHGPEGLPQLQSLFGNGGRELRFPLLPLERLASFQNLKGFIEELVKLDKEKTLFNSLDEEDDRTLERLAALVESLFDYQVPEDFLARAGLYASAASEAHGQDFRPQIYREEIASRLRTLVEDFHHNLYTDSPLLEVLDALESELDRVRQGAWFAENGTEGIARLTELLSEAERLLERDEVAWAFLSRFDLGPAYDQAMALVAETEFVAPEVPQQLLRESEVQWIAFRSALADYRSPITGSLLALDDSGRAMPQLSADVLVLKTALQGFEDERFMVAQRGQVIRTTVPAGSVMRWDTNLLQQAVGLYEPYTRFREGGLAFFPPELRGPLQLVATRRLEAGLTDLVSRSQSMAPAPALASPRLFQQELRGEIEILQQAAPVLAQLLAILEELKLWDAHRKLTHLLANQGFKFLQEVERLLESKELYEPLEGDFAWWDGGGSLALSAFDVADEGELAIYLDRQRDRVQHLARNLAQPLVASLGAARGESDATNGSLFVRWQEILAELDAYDDKRPGNSISDLEGFILEELPKKTLGSCPREAAQRPRTGARKDYFRVRLANLRSSLKTRCTSLVAGRAVNGYRSLAQEFDRTLAGRYPFVVEDALDATATTAVEPEVLRTFFAEFDRHVDLVTAVPEDDESFDGRGPAVQEFMSRMRRVRAFFAPLLDPPEEGQDPMEVPTYDVRVEMRVNREKEEGANGILRWSLGVGDEVLTQRDLGTRSRWEFGEPVRLSLQWAADGIWTPVAPSDRPGVWVDGRTAVFERTDRWALLGLLRQYQGARRDFVEFEDPQPHTLRFEIDTVRRQPQPVADEGGKKKKEENPGVVIVTPATARVFVRIEVLAPEGEEPLQLPIFPPRAPRLPEEEGDDAGEVRRAR